VVSEKALDRVAQDDLLGVVLQVQDVRSPDMSATPFEA
jgi:hypothetical protein